MCLIVVNQVLKITLSEFESMWSINKDGLGIMYLNHNKEIVTFKMLAKNIIELEYFYDVVYSPIYNNQENSEIVIHFRYATDGDINLKNCHPFVFENKHGEFALMHNGVMPNKYRNYSCSSNYVTSDTNNFVEDFLKAHDLGFNEEDKKKITDEVGYNKLVVLSPIKLHIINENLFHYRNGNMFSNLNWIRYENRYEVLNFFK